MPLSPEHRLALLRDLNALALSEFETLLSALRVPPGTISSGMAQQGIRSTQLLEWAEIQGGEDFHDRFVLTDQGGLMIGAGFAAQGMIEVAMECPL